MGKECEPVSEACLFCTGCGNSILIKTSPQHGNSTLLSRLEGCEVYEALENPFNQIRIPNLLFLMKGE